MLLTFAKDKSINNGRNTGHRVTDVYHKRCPLACGKPTDISSVNARVAEEENARVQNTSIGDIESRNVELFKHNLRHSFSVGRAIPSGFRDKDGVFTRVDAHNLGQCILDQRLDGFKVLY